MSPEIVGIILAGGSYIAVSVWTVAVTASAVKDLQRRADAADDRIRELELNQATNHGRNHP